MKILINVHPELIILNLLENITISENIDVLLIDSGILILIYKMSYFPLLFFSFASNKRDKMFYV